MDFIEGAPPTSTNCRSRRTVDELKERPGVWAKFTLRHRGSVSYMAAKLKSLGCEVTTRGLNLYARWPEPK